MEPISVLEVGHKYSKKDLASLIDEPGLLNVREGVFPCKNSNSYLLFVDLEKEDKEKRFHFDDFFEEDFFHWDSQTTQHIDSPKIQEVVTGSVVTYLSFGSNKKRRVRLYHLSIAVGSDMSPMKRGQVNRFIFYFKILIMMILRTI